MTARPRADMTLAVGWSSNPAYQSQSQMQFNDPSFSDGPSVKARLVTLIAAVRTLMRSPSDGSPTPDRPG